MPASAREAPVERGRYARAAFAAFYVVVMTSVIGSAPLRPDHVFGFQMFNQSSTLTIHLYRRVRGSDALVPAPEGSWQARTKSHGIKHFRWQDRVKDDVIGVIDAPVHARYGLEGQLFRLRLALDDVLAHTTADAETTALIAEVETLRNGRESGMVRLEAVRP